MEQGLIASRQACLSQAPSAAAARISGQGIDLVRLVNLCKSRQVGHHRSLPHGTQLHHQLQQGRATLFTFGLKPVSVCQLHANNAAETDKTSDLE
eukprot:363324-Chlamydomonas_euryale.AAC.27